MMHRSLKILLPHLAVAMLVANAGTAVAETKKAAEQRYPDVIDVKITAHGGNRFDFDATISSPYDSETRYADAFRVVGADGAVLGERTLFHDHADEQPFTRALRYVTIPPQYRSVTIQGRDKRYGYGGKIVERALPGR